MIIPKTITAQLLNKAPRTSNRSRKDEFYWETFLPDKRFNQHIHISDLSDEHLLNVERKIKSFPRESLILGKKVSDWISRIQIEKKIRKNDEIRTLSMLDKIFSSSRKDVNIFTHMLIVAKQENSLL